jgi:2-polyprenyl-3-methyl-5-hydroxy-6-metoxy-1,4-benzoquinol methylase
MLTVRFDRLGAHAGDRVLDLGCGFGRHSYALARSGVHVVALDAGREEVTGTQQMLGAMALEHEFDPAVTLATAVRGDAHRLPFPDATFDHIICSEVLEHIPDDVTVLRDIVRVLRPGGTLAVTVPRYAPERINWWLSTAYHSVPGGHIRIYRRRVLRMRLTEAGVVVRGTHHAHALHTPYWWLKCLVGTTNDQHWLVRQYHRLLVWDIMKAPRTTRWTEALLNPVMGKSLVIYCTKPATS